MESFIHFFAWGRSQTIFLEFFSRHQKVAARHFFWQIKKNWCNTVRFLRVVREANTSKTCPSNLKLSEIIENTNITNVANDLATTISGQETASIVPTLSSAEVLLSTQEVESASPKTIAFGSRILSQDAIGACLLRSGTTSSPHQPS